MSNANSVEGVMRKALDILKGELTREEYLTYLEAITPKVGDATKELRELTKDLTMDEVLGEVRKREKAKSRARTS